ncbi:MAG TPA: phosphatidate cytidylyltransferase [Bacillales bacterium]|nr:phosphatidate cytidylyltransferase [Bacillales bacterium]
MKQRMITAIVAGILFLVVAAIGGAAFTVLSVILALVGFAELLRMEKLNFFSIPAVIGFILVLLIVIGIRYDSLSTMEWFGIAFFLLLAFTVLSKNNFHFDQAAFVVFSALYVGLGFHYLIEVRSLNNGTAMLFFVLLLIWATDSGAYFTGGAFGKRKLWPEISPKKTVEGAIGGIVIALIVAVFYQLVFKVYDSMALVLIAALSIGVFSQLGDLVESALKRHYGIKDSGTILPGHGGILDRCDSWLFVLPILHFMNFI